MSSMSDDKGALSLFAEPKDVLPDGIDITPKQDGGIYKIIEKQGEGEETPGYGDKVSVHYNTTLVDGSEVESSHQAAQMFEYVIGEGNLAEACDIGLTTMKLYEKARFACRCDYTTNDKDDEIPIDATTMIHVELCKWKREDISPLRDESMLRKVIERGVGKETPQDGSTVTAHIIGIYDDSVFDDRVVTFSLGEGIEHDIVDGVEHAISRFTLKERSKIYMTAPHVFGEQGCPERNIPPNSDVEYEITLNDFEQVKAYSSRVAVEKLTYAEQAKGKGNNYFKSGHYKRAIRFYQRAVRILTIDTSKAFDGDAEKNQAESILLACYLNQGQCNLKLRNFNDVLENCGHALKISACNEKAYYRRGQAYLSRGDLEEALLDFKKVIKLDPGNKPAANQLSITQRQIQVHREKQKSLYTKMFSGVTEPESETMGNAASKNDTENGTESEDKNEA